MTEVWNIYINYEEEEEKEKEEKEEERRNVKYIIWMSVYMQLIELKYLNQNIYHPNYKATNCIMGLRGAATAISEGKFQSTISNMFPSV